MRFFPTLLISGFCVCFFSTIQAAYTIKDGKLLHTYEVATLSVQEHYSAALEAYQKEKWDELIHQAVVVIKNFPDTPFAIDAKYYLGVGFFHVQEYELANKHLTSYLKSQSAPKYFEEALKFKFEVAERYQQGAKKHLLGLESMPKWVPAREEAIAIYDEIITALPHHELAVRSLFGKAQILLRESDYKLSVETYQTLIRKFPKHPLACESYIGIAEVFLKQCKEEYPDPDFLDLAEINFRKFKQDFPNEPRISVAQNMLASMQEHYAKDLFETAKFYERTKKKRAALIYHNKIVAKYPMTKVAAQSRKRIDEAAREHADKAPKALPTQEGVLVSKEDAAQSLQEHVEEGSSDVVDGAVSDASGSLPEVMYEETKR